MYFLEGFYAVVEGLSKFKERLFCGKFCRPLRAPRPLGRHQVHSSSGLLVGTESWVCARCGLFECAVRVSVITRVRRLVFAPCRARLDWAGLRLVWAWLCAVLCHAVCAVLGRAVLCWPPCAALRSAVPCFAVRRRIRPAGHVQLFVVPWYMVDDIVCCLGSGAVAVSAV